MEWDGVGWSWMELDGVGWSGVVLDGVGWCWMERRDSRAERSRKRAVRDGRAGLGVSCGLVARAFGSLPHNCIKMCIMVRAWRKRGLMGK